MLFMRRVLIARYNDDSETELCLLLYLITDNGVQAVVSSRLTRTTMSISVAHGSLDDFKEKAVSYEVSTSSRCRSQGDFRDCNNYQRKLSDIRHIVKMGQIQMLKFTLIGTMERIKQIMRPQTTTSNIDRLWYGRFRKHHPTSY
jgi:hypothetical protein